MEYVNLGSTGLRVSRLCLGMMSFGTHETRPWALGEEEAEPIVRRAVESGITFFDTADTYNGGQSEVITGRLLRKLFTIARSTSSRRRCSCRRCPARTAGGLAQAHHGLDRRLAERLELDYVDLYQIHRWDPHTRSRRRWKRFTRS